jgi:hypothetical protein
MHKKSSGITVLPDLMNSVFLTMHASDTEYSDFSFRNIRARYT